MKRKKRKKELKNTLNQLTCGVLRVHPRGFGFLQTEEKEKYEEDIFIPKHLTKGAVDGDIVEVEVNLDHPSEKGLDGKVIQIIKRGRSHVGGTIVRIQRGGSAYAFVPLLGSENIMKISPSKERKFEEGDRIVIRVLEWGTQSREPLGEMCSYIGHISDPSCDLQAAIEEFELPGGFPTKTIEEAQKYGKTVRPKEIQAREDLRDLECFTIDPDTAKDYDDALSLTQDEKGHFHLGVHIADVSHYVRPGTELDDEARSRCNSTYLPGYVIPMLPHELSSHLCSLKEGVARLAVSVLITLDETGEVLNYKIKRSTIKSRCRFTYREAKEVLDGVRKSPHKETLFMMVELCHRLKRKRYERGSIEFSMPSIELFVDEKGNPQKIDLVEYDITHQLVEEFMLKANEIVATHLAKKGKPLTYRVHDEPNPENMRDFALLARGFGFNLPAEPTAESLQTLFDTARGTPFGQFLATAFIRSMKLANYSIQNIGHYGLGLEYYTHFTSPIRRYIDLVVHRTLLEELDKDDDLEKIALECSEQERLSAKAEQSVSHLKKLRLLKHYQEKNPHHIFEAVITQVKPHGVIFEITEFLLEGYLSLSNLEGDFYVYQEAERRLVGNHTRKVFQSGTTLPVTLKQLDLVTREVRWAAIQDERKKSKKRK